jgi:hypothetical protein
VPVIGQTVALWNMTPYYVVETYVKEEPPTSIFRVIILFYPEIEENGFLRNVGNTLSPSSTLLMFFSSFSSFSSPSSRSHICPFLFSSFFPFFFNIERSTNNLVGIVTMLTGRPKNRDSIPERDKGFPLFSTASTPDLGLTQPRSQWVPGAFQVVNGPIRENEHSHSSSVEVTNEWSYTSIPHSAVLYSA